MKAIQKVLSLLLAAVCLFSLPACSGQAPAASETDTVPSQSAQSGCVSSGQPEPREGGAIAITDENVRFLGRVAYLEDRAAYMLGWTQSGIEFRFHGTGAALKMQATTRTMPNASPYIQVFIDGEQDPSLGEKIQVMKGDAAWVTIAEGLPAGEHTVKVVKSTQNAYNQIALTDIRLSAGGELLDPPPAKERLIEAFGDSILCGIDILSSADKEVYDPSCEDGYLTYPAEIARRLDADINMLCASGWGMWKTLSAIRTDIDVNMAVPSLYPYTDLFNDKSQQKWDFTRPADVVIVSLGTNDRDAVLAEGEDGPAQYEQAAKAFAQSIRAENPDAAIIFTMGLIIDDLYPNLENVVRELNESGDTNVYSFRHEYGNEGHPRVDVNLREAERLADFIREVKNW